MEEIIENNIDEKVEKTEEKKSIRQFYFKELRDELLILEGDRKKIIKLSIMLAGTALLAAMIVGVSNLFNAIGERATAQKSVISFLTVSGLNVIPVGNCIQALATNIHNAEIDAPNTVSQVEAK